MGTLAASFYKASKTCWLISSAHSLRWRRDQVQNKGPQRGENHKFPSPTPQHIWDWRQNGTRLTDFITDFINVLLKMLAKGNDGSEPLSNVVLIGVCACSWSLLEGWIENPHRAPTASTKLLVVPERAGLNPACISVVHLERWHALKWNLEVFPWEIMTLHPNLIIFQFVIIIFWPKSWRCLFADKTGFAVFCWKYAKKKKIEANMLSVDVFNLVWKLKFIQENERRKFLAVPKPKPLWFSTWHGSGMAWLKTRSRLGDSSEPLFSISHLYPVHPQHFAFSGKEVLVVISINSR